MSEHDFNTAGLPPWAGLKAPPAGGRPDARILGVPMERGSLYRPGQAKAPAHLRKISAIFAPVTERAELFDSVTLQDDGDLTLVDGDMGANVDAVADEIARTPSGTLPIVLGGDHTTVSPTLIAQQRQLNGRLSILYIDAHPDLNDVSRQSRWSNGCALRRGLEMGEIDPKKVTLLGCRDFDWEEVEYIRKTGVTLIPAATAHGWTGNHWIRLPAHLARHRFPRPELRAGHRGTRRGWPDLAAAPGFPAAAARRQARWTRRRRGRPAAGLRPHHEPGRAEVHLRVPRDGEARTDGLTSSSSAPAWWAAAWRSTWRGRAAAWS